MKGWGLTSSILFFKGKAAVKVESSRLWETNKQLSYKLLKSVGEVMARRFDHAVGEHGIAELTLLRPRV